MSRRSKEGDVLREMTATLNRTITDQSDPVWFGDAVSSAGFISQQATMDITSTGTISEYDKVRRIASAVVSHITCQRSPEMVSQKFDQFVLLVHHQLKLDDLARKLVGKMCAVKPGYRSPIGRDESPSTSCSVDSGGTQLPELADELVDNARTVAGIRETVARRKRDTYRTPSQLPVPPAHIVWICVAIAVGTMASGYYIKSTYCMNPNEQKGGDGGAGATNNGVFHTSGDTLKGGDGGPGGGNGGPGFENRGLRVSKGTTSTGGAGGPVSDAYWWCTLGHWFSLLIITMALTVAGYTQFYIQTMK